ncbi:glycosyltransferase family 4 protein [Leeuwenhoekiella sp. A16]|uniref:glycosyltransferase family 4 protein n=1 Tax=Leeuwenhoekiella sp. A16 TaxID=3141462 RepID=UPI003A8048DA
MIVVNARFLSQPITGVQRYALEISKRLRILFDDSELCFLAPPNVVNNKESAALKVKTVGNFTGHFWEQFELPFFVKKSDLLINFCNTAPLSVRNKITVIHDLAYHFDNGWYDKKFKILYQFLIPRIFQNSKKIVTVSNTVKHEILNQFQNVQNKNISVIPCTLADDFHQASSIVKESKLLLCVGSMDPRKNLKNLIKAFDYIEDKDIILKVVGGSGKSFIQGYSFSEEKSSQIKFLGRVSDEELRILYSKSYAFIFPSLYEGFGLPPLEALHFKCVLLGSDIPVFKEIYKDVMVYFNPLDPKDIASKISYVFSNSKEFSSLKSQKILSKYTLDKSTELWVELIKNTI